MLVLLTIMLNFRNTKHKEENKTVYNVSITARESYSSDLGNYVVYTM